MKNSKMVLIWSGIVIEFAGIALIAKSMGSDSSPAVGIALLAIGVVMMVIGMATKPKESQISKAWNIKP